jgi:SPP1 family predicted phage head-tail adaptor
MRPLQAGFAVKVRSGSLDRQISLYGGVETKRPGGQLVHQWVHQATLYAQRLELRTVDSARAGQRDTYAVARFLIRYRPGLTTAHRLVVDGVTFDILNVDERDRRATMILTVEEATLDPIVVT